MQVQHTKARLNSADTLADFSRKTASVLQIIIFEIREVKV